MCQAVFKRNYLCVVISGVKLAMRELIRKRPTAPSTVLHVNLNSMSKSSECLQLLLLRFILPA